MFFYISFLRPPPLQAATSGPVSITPQIANDLRTEPFNGSQDIFYSWSQVQTMKAHEDITKATKLTSWRPSNAYKEISVPLPPGPRTGQSWRLKLSARNQGGTDIDLADPALGELPFSVTSAPILFGSGGTKRSGKQEQIERTYRLRGAGRAESIVSLNITEQTSFDLDKVSKLYPSFLHMCDAV